MAKWLQLGLLPPKAIALGFHWNKDRYYIQRSLGWTPFQQVRTISKRQKALPMSEKRYLSRASRAGLSQSALIIVLLESLFSQQLVFHHSEAAILFTFFATVSATRGALRAHGKRIEGDTLGFNRGPYHEREWMEQQINKTLGHFATETLYSVGNWAGSLNFFGLDVFTVQGYEKVIWTLFGKSCIDF